MIAASTAQQNRHLLYTLGMLPNFAGQMLLGQYRVEAFVTATPLGDFYRAWDSRHNKQVGLTAIPEEISANADALKALETAAALRAHLKHPNLLPFYGLIQTTRHAFLLEEWSDGPSLRDVLEQQPGQPLSVTESLSYVKAISAALEYLREQNLAHLALAPEMIHINRDGQIRLGGVGMCLPFGDAGTLRPGKYPPLYATPEQYGSKPISSASDIYGLGILLFEMLTGRWINRSTETDGPPDDESIRRVHTFLLPPVPRTLNPAIPDFASRLLLKALAKRPDERPNSASEFYLSLCMACHIASEDLPLRITVQAMPRSAEALANWHYQPSDDEKSSAIELKPIVKNLSAAGAPPIQEKGRQGWLRPVFGMLLVFVFIFLLSQIKPAESAIIPPAQGGKPVNVSPAPTLTRGPQPTDVHGGRIIFTCSRGDFNQLCLINADGTNYRRLTSHTAHDYYPMFSPQGGMIVFASNRGGAFDLYLLIFNGSKLYQLTDHIGNVVSPDFSPDGDKIVFANRAAEGPTSIWVVDKAGLNPKLLYAGPNTIVATAWAPDGQTIAFAMAVDQPDSYQIFLMNPDATNIRQLTSNLAGIGGSIDWSPDGSKLLIYAGPGGDKDLYTIDVQTGAATQLTDGGNNAAASFSPDGRWIVFNSLRNNGQADLYIMRADGTDLRQLTADPEPDWQPQWEP